MAWTVPRTWTAGMVVGATAMNSDVRDNMNFLLNGKDVTLYNLTGNYSTTQSAWTDLWSGTATNTTTRAAVWVHAYWKTYLSTAFFRLTLNGSASIAYTTGQSMGAGNWDTLFMTMTGLPTGTYTAAIQAHAWGNATAQFGTAAGWGALPTTVLLMEV